jgi:hypothetical protein
MCCPGASRASGLYTLCVCVCVCVCVYTRVHVVVHLACSSADAHDERPAHDKYWTLDGVLMLATNFGAAISKARGV